MTNTDDWRSNRIWGAKEIAHFAGVCTDTIRNWAKLPDCPITQINGRYFVLKSALMAWLTRKVPA